jgi:hypothetical protein
VKLHLSRTQGQVTTFHPCSIRNVICITPLHDLLQVPVDPVHLPEEAPASQVCGNALHAAAHFLRKTFV